MTKPVLKKRHVREAIKRTREKGDDWLYRNSPAVTGGKWNPAKTWFLLDSGTLFPLKSLGRLAHKIARKPVPDKKDNSVYFKNRFIEAGFDVVKLIDNKEAREAKRKHQQVKVWSREQAKFREEVFERYGRACVISGCKEEAALEAAHIVPVKDGGPDKAENGIPLRADIHRLFDAGLLNINPDNWRLALASGVAKNCPDSGRWIISPRFRKANHGKDVIAELRERNQRA